MNPFRIYLLVLTLGLGFSLNPLAQTDPPAAPAPSTNSPPGESAADVPPLPVEAVQAEIGNDAPEEVPVVAEPPDARPDVAPPEIQPARRPAASRPVPRSGSTRSPTPGSGREEPRNLRLNFRGVPLEMVLNYLSEAAGFIINLETEVQGKVDAWSNQPLSKDEAVDLLNTVLNKNGYAAIRNGRTLTIVGHDDAKKRNIPVVTGSDPAGIPRNDEIVTQIMPVRFINAVQLVKDLTPLISDKEALSANEGGNALVVTDTQNNIRRLAEIIQALDQAISSVSRVKVFQLQNADSKALATTLTQLFQPQDATRNNNNNNQGGAARFFAQFRGGPPGANPAGGGGGNDANSAGGNGRAPTPRVVAVSDERSNSVIVSAPEDQMEVIAGIIQDVDTVVEDITELRVFRLKHADPQETADLLTDLFTDSSSSRQNNGNNNNRGNFQPRFGQGGGFAQGNAGGRGNGGANGTSDRTVKQTRVTAVPDLRTRSVVVSASKDLMVQISLILNQLDEDPARKQKVWVYSVENSDPQAVQQVLETLFPEQNLNQNRNTRNAQNQNTSQLNDRQTQTRNQSRTSGALGRNGNNSMNGSTFGGNNLGSP